VLIKANCMLDCIRRSINRGRYSFLLRTPDVSSGILCSILGHQVRESLTSCRESSGRPLKCLGDCHIVRS